MPDLSEELDIFVEVLRPGIEVDLNTGNAISCIRPSIRSLRKPDRRAVGPRESVGPYNQPEIGRASLRRPWAPALTSSCCLTRDPGGSMTAIMVTFVETIPATE